MNERRVIAVALVVIAATMVVNLFARTERSAEAQSEKNARVVSLTAVSTGDNCYRLFRTWSHGQTETAVVFLDPPNLTNSEHDALLQDWGPCPEKP